MTDSADREKYVDQVANALRPSGFLVIATFALDGPSTCSGLKVERFSVEKLVKQFGSRFTLLNSSHEMHRTPSGGVQSFVYALMRRNAM